MRQKDEETHEVLISSGLSPRFSNPNNYTLPSLPSWSFLTPLTFLGMITASLSPHLYRHTLVLTACWLWFLSASQSCFLKEFCFFLSKSFVSSFREDPLMANSPFLFGFFCLKSLTKLLVLKNGLAEYTILGWQSFSLSTLKIFLSSGFEKASVNLTFLCRYSISSVNF